ncbi:hypothetical protein KM92DES2_12270 [uncultured Desulfovibrio sp.]|uniref:Uncharacterized protein n=1 Tax=uncultured Desulfovibrio sp. TaxID=167968 RepID=A0A212K5I3_9BACT|nr:hypothetical protein KM92DES2_12270 [uncultured Desulfovibrio sp.]
MSINAFLRFEPDSASAHHDFLNTSLGYGENNGRPDLRCALPTCTPAWPMKTPPTGMPFNEGRSII